MAGGLTLRGDNAPQAREFLEEWRDRSRPTVRAHTSGSTGRPKPVDLLKTDMEVSARATCDFFNLRGDSRLLLPLSTDYIAGKMMVVRADITGAELIAEHPSSSPLGNDYGPVDLMAVVPSQLPSLMANRRFGCIKNLIVGGGAIPPSVERALQHHYSSHVYATYGMTETCSHVALRDVSAGMDFYEALPHVTFDINERGALVIHCAEMSFGSLTTTDAAELISPTRFRWLGRLDNAINSGGIKIHPETVEAKVSALVDVPFYMTGRQSDRWGEELVMYTEGEIDRERFMTAARALLPGYELPKAIVAVERFQRTDSGKIKRVLL